MNLPPMFGVNVLCDATQSCFLHLFPGDELLLEA